MADFPAMPLWTDAQETRSFLIQDGWRSPDTYDNFFCDLINGPAVYLFLLHKITDYKYHRAVVAYVGMSEALRHRINGHNVLPKLRKPGYWPMRWFKPTPVEALRDVERKYIAEFDPPWNIIGRKRGFALS